jgi:hypothetical protein
LLALKLFVVGGHEAPKTSGNQEIGYLHEYGRLKTMEAILIPSSQQHHARYIHGCCTLFSVIALNSLGSIYDGMYQHPNCIHFSLKLMQFLNDWSPFLPLLSLVPSATAGSETLLKLSYQSKGIAFSDWVSLFTLCLTPLVLHVIAGTPQVVCLFYTRKNLKWHRRFCLYNPTTIIWRYFAIADRRIRAKEWSAADIAASNVVFWTPRGWDGSEEMIQGSRLYCLKFPDNSRATIFSKNFVKTVVITIQGVQAIIFLIEGFTTPSVFLTNIAIDTIFFPLAVLGLLRLCAALWLTEDYLYAEHEDRSTTLALKQRTADPQTMPHLPVAQSTSSKGLLDPADYTSETRFHPINSWRGWLFRIIFLILLLLLWAMCLIYMIPPGEDEVYQAPTHLLGQILYILILSATFIIYAYYFIWERSATTIIPCIVSTWYQIYTCILILMMLVLIVIAAVETRKTMCGTYTIWPAGLTGNDAWTCRGTYVSSNLTAGVPFGIATRYVAPYNTTLLPQGEYRIAVWDGLCIGD